MSRLPAYYIPHGGGPCFFMDWDPEDTWIALAAWMRGLCAGLSQKPKAILFLSAHWEEREFTLLTNPSPHLYYDYYGFPEHTYTLSWPINNSKELNLQALELLAIFKITTLEDTERDFDHGVFIPGLLLLPKADLPILQISLRKGLDVDAHFKLGQALALLREKGVLIIGSGMSFHNMREFRHGDNTPIEGSDIFDSWLTQTIELNDEKERAHRLYEWYNAPNARFCHPREEHLMPLMVVAGTGGKGKRVFHCRSMGAPLSAYEFL